MSDQDHSPENKLIERLRQKVELARAGLLPGQGAKYHVIARAQIDPNKVTRKTRHYSAGELLAAPSRVEIVQFNDANEYYLLYFDSAGSETTDTWHESIAGAMKQAELEFGLQAGDWIMPTEPDVEST